MLKAGVYLDYNQHSAIVVRVKDGKVVYLTMNKTKPTVCAGRIVHEVESQRVCVVSVDDSAFTRQYGRFLPDYPILRAAKIYWRSGLDMEDEARKVLEILIRNLAQQKSSAAKGAQQ